MATASDREKVGKARVRYVGVKPYGWFWNRTWQATWVVEVFSVFVHEDYMGGWDEEYFRWEEKHRTVSLAEAEQECERWTNHPEHEVDEA